MADNTPGFQPLLNLTEVMLQKAKDGLWDDVMALEAERDSLIRLFFSEPVPQDDAGSVAEGIHTILAIDKEIMELGAVKRFDLLQTLQEMGQGKKAVKAYTS